MPSLDRRHADDPTPLKTSNKHSSTLNHQQFKPLPTRTVLPDMTEEETRDQLRTAIELESRYRIENLASAD